MKTTTPAALLSAGLILSGALFAQDTPAQKETDSQTESKPIPAKPVTPAGESTPGSIPEGATTKAPGVEPKPVEKPRMDPAKIKTLTSYGFGYRNGRNFASQVGRYGLDMTDDLDREQFLKGLFDALDLKDSALDQDEINEALTQLSTLIKEREAKLAEDNKAAGEKFLAENKKREGVITTESGLQYEILKEGKGEVYQAPPEGQRPNKQFMTIYHGTLIDGTEFDSSKGEPSPMSLNVIPGFKEALTQMPVGSKWKLFIPAELGYKETRRSSLLGPNSTLIFELELTEIKDLPTPPSGPGPRPNIRPGATNPGGAVSPPVRVPGAKSVSPPVRVPAPGQRAVSPPVRIPTNPETTPKAPPTPKETAPKPAPEGEKPAPAPAPEAPKPENSPKPE